MIQSIIAIPLVIGGLIFFHELGHFFVGRLFGIGVRKFSLGFGPKLAGYVSGATEYKLSAVPLGGYVQFVGEGADDALPAGFTPEQSFNRRPAWQRMLVVLAGPLSNFILAWLLYWVIFFASGQPEVLPKIGDIQDNTPAKAAGLMTGDEVLRIGSRSIVYWEDLAETIQASEGKPLVFTIRRDSKTLEVEVTPELQVRKNIFGEEVRLPMVGIAASGETVVNKLGFGQAAVTALEQTWTVTSLTVQGFVKIIERIVPLDSIGGPIMIAQMVSQQAEAGVFNVMALAALISINLGIINLLPIPVLDGGHILFFALESVSGKPLNERWQSVATRMGLAFLLALMALALFNDLARVF